MRSLICLLFSELYLQRAGAVVVPTTKVSTSRAQHCVKRAVLEGEEQRKRLQGTQIQGSVPHCVLRNGVAELKSCGTVEFLTGLPAKVVRNATAVP